MANLLFIPIKVSYSRNSKYNRETNEKVNMKKKKQSGADRTRINLKMKYSIFSIDN